VESPLANVVDTNHTAVAKVRKAYLPSRLDRYGVHAALRAQAATHRG
jgi:hypothetical protein